MTDYTIRATGSSEPHLHYRHPSLLARLRAAWMADYEAGYRDGYSDGYEHTDEEDPDGTDR